MPRSFGDTLGDLGRGSVYEELGLGLSDLASAVREHGKVGELTLKLKPVGEGQVTVETALAVKAPQPPRPSTIMFVGKDGSLMRQDPRQQTMDLKVVDQPEEEARELPEEEAPAPDALRTA